MAVASLAQSPAISMGAFGPTRPPPRAPAKHPRDSSPPQGRQLLLTAVLLRFPT